jgi:hypothetical protein
MSANIPNLIDKQDNSELIRDEIASVLFVEKENQKNLAAIANKNPALWDFSVSTEKFIPWHLLEDDEGKILGDTPLVNVYFDQMQANQGGSNPIKDQQINGTFIIDVIAGKNTTVNCQGDNVPGDVLAAADCQRVMRLVRNIIMSAVYIYIFTGEAPSTGRTVPAPGIVTERKFSQIQVFRPQINDRPAEKVIAARMSLNCVFYEESPQISGVPITLISSECTRRRSVYLGGFKNVN